MELIYSKEWYEARIAQEGDSEIGAGSMLSLLPKKIIRIDDGMEFLLNESTGKYRIHLGIPHLDDPKHLHNEYTYEELMKHSTIFKVSDGTEDLEAIRRNWLKQIRIRNDGHGNEDDECGKGRE